MGFLDFIKKKIFGRFNKNKGLPKGSKEPITVENMVVSDIKQTIESEEFNKQLQVDFSPKPQTLDFALSQYVLGLLHQYNSGEYVNSYRVLTGLSALNNSSPGNNKKNEEILIENIKRNQGLTLIEQKDSKGNIGFNHVMSKAPRKEHDTRVYINCKRENVAELANKFIQEFGDKPFYFKFCSDNQASKTGRSEQFVFYTNSKSDELNTVLSTIERTKQKHPKLFEGAENTNPFMKNISGYLAYAPEVDDIFIGLDNKKRPISQSYNSLLSSALEDSFTNAICDLSARDYELAKKMDGKIYDEPAPYIIQVLGDVVNSPDRLKDLVQKMKQNLSMEVSKNPKLDIKGINFERTQETELVY